MTRSRKALFALSALTLSAVTVFACGEVLSRVAFPDRQLRYTTDDRALYRFTPNQKGIQLLATGEATPFMEINELGFRGSAIRDSSGGRLLVLGDSFAFGFGVEDHETFSARLDTALGSEVQVVNGGQPGYGVYQMDEALSRVGPELAPRRVILVVWQGDFVRQPLSPEEHRRFLDTDRMQKAIKSSVFATHLFRLVSRGIAAMGGAGVGLQVGETQVSEDTEALIESHLAGMRADLPRIRALHQRAREWGEGVFLVFWAREGFASTSPPGLSAALTRDLADFAAREEIPFVTTQPVFTPLDTKQVLIPGDWHPTSYAHCLVAQYLLGALVRQGETIEEPMLCEPPESVGG